MELSDLARVGVDGEEEEGSTILGKGEVNRIDLSRFSGTGIGSPADRFPDRGPEITKGKRYRWKDKEMDEREKCWKQTKKRVVHHCLNKSYRRNLLPMGIGRPMKMGRYEF